MMIVGVAGGTGSGKTTFAKALSKLVPTQAVIITQDSYYASFSELSFEERVKINYDHPDSFEDSLLIEHLKALRRGESIEVPVYDFAAYTRSQDVIKVEPVPIVIVEGILVLANPELRRLFDLKIFVDNDPDVRALRRLIET